MILLYGESRANRRNAGGFTLVELLTALAVTGVAISIFFSLFRASLMLADASVLVTQGAGDSPSLTIQALALRGAEALAWSV